MNGTTKFLTTRIFFEPRVSELGWVWKWVKWQTMNSTSVVDGKFVKVYKVSCTKYHCFVQLRIFIYCLKQFHLQHLHIFNEVKTPDMHCRTWVVEKVHRHLANFPTHKYKLPRRTWMHSNFCPTNFNKHWMFINASSNYWSDKQIVLQKLNKCWAEQCSKSLHFFGKIILQIDDW